jgi:hypothetical protein
MNMNLKRMRNILRWILMTSMILFLVLSPYFVLTNKWSIAEAEPKQYETSLGKLKDQILLLNEGNRVRQDSSGQLHILFGYVLLQKDWATLIGDSIEVYTGLKEPVPSDITLEVIFVQDKITGKWLATDGFICIHNGSLVLLDGHKIKVLGGVDDPINIAGRPFSNTTIIIKNGKPVVQDKAIENQTHSLTSDTKKEMSKSSNNQDTTMTETEARYSHDKVKNEKKKSITIHNPIVNSKDGSNVVLTGPAPDGQKAKLIIPNGHGFASAKLMAFDTNEPLTVNVNKWLNKLFKTNAKEYVDPKLYISPILTNDGNFDMEADDIKMVNNQLRANGFNLKIFSSGRGLDFSETKF